jgi:hypothetical protein
MMGEATGGLDGVAPFFFSGKMCQNSGYHDFEGYQPTIETTWPHLLWIGAFELDGAPHPIPFIEFDGRDINQAVV